MRWPTLVSAAVHVAIVAFLLLSSFWDIKKVEARYTPVILTGDGPPAPAPPPPPPPAGGAKVTKAQPKPRVAKEIVQPQQVEKRVLEDEPEGAGQPGGQQGGEDGGQIGGEIGGKIDGILGGIPGGTGHAPVTTPPQKPVTVAPVMIEGGRIAGNAQIHLPDSTKNVMRAQGISKAEAIAKICLTTGGAPSSIELTKSTGFSDADEKIRREMNAWRYRPYLLDGKPVPVCTTVVFRYVMR